MNFDLEPLCRTALERAHGCAIDCRFEKLQNWPVRCHERAGQETAARELLGFCRLARVAMMMAAVLFVEPAQFSTISETSMFVPVVVHTKLQLVGRRLRRKPRKNQRSFPETSIFCAGVNWACDSQRVGKSEDCVNGYGNLLAPRCRAVRGLPPRRAHASTSVTFNPQSSALSSVHANQCEHSGEAPLASLPYRGARLR